MLAVVIFYGCYLITPPTQSTQSSGVPLSGSTSESTLGPAISKGIFLTGMPVYREPTEWCNVWISNTDKDDLPRVLLVGDSITQQYYSHVERELVGKAYCARLTTSACVADPMFAIQLRSVIEQYEFNVVQINNGLHGMGYTEKEYRRGYEDALRLIREKKPNAKIIVVLSTPTKAGGSKAYLIPRMEIRNGIIGELAENISAGVIDLFTPMQGHPEYYRDDYHFHSKAIAIQAKLVAKAIREILN